MASKDELYKHPQYASRHDDAFDARHAQVSGEVAAGTLSDDHSLPSNFPTGKVSMSSEDFAELYHEDAKFVAEYSRRNAAKHSH